MAVNDGSFGGVASGAIHDGSRIGGMTFEAIHDGDHISGLTSGAVYLLSLGCDKNKVDGEVMLGRLLDVGYENAADPAEAEIIIVNTCGFIREAVQESIDLILEMAAYKKTGCCRKLVVVGCMTERYREEMGTELPEVDAVLGVEDRDKIVFVVQDKYSEVDSIPTDTPKDTPKDTPVDTPTVMEIDMIPYQSEKLSLEPDLTHYRLLARKTASYPHIAYVKIAEGCDNHCTYCTIPAIRGGYKSRTHAEILKECGALIASGVREIVLVAQDTARYGVDLYGEAPQLPELLHSLDALCVERQYGITDDDGAGNGNSNNNNGNNDSGKVWIRLLYAYPEHITEDLIDALAELPSVCKYLDMPIQHSEDSVLARMGRRGSRKALTDLVARLRARVPGITLRTTLMVGFPGETVKEFNGLLRFVREMRFDRLGVFPYSREEGTPAANMSQQVSEKTKQTRRDRIMELQQEIHREKQRAKIGQPTDIMVDGPDPSGDNPRRYVGRTQGDAPEVDAVVYFSHNDNLNPGQVVTLVPTDSDEYDLYA